jgi:hypothetical protein
VPRGSLFKQIKSNPYILKIATWKTKAISHQCNPGLDETFAPIRTNISFTSTMVEHILCPLSIMTQPMIDLALAQRVPSLSISFLEIPSLKKKLSASK